VSCEINYNTEKNVGHSFVGSNRRCFLIIVDYQNFMNKVKVVIYIVEIHKL